MRALLVVLVLLASGAARGEGPSDRFEPIDVFSLEYASDPQISPDGERIVYVRRSADIMSDRFVSSLWLIDADGTDHRALAQGGGSYGSPRWSPSGDRILYTASEEGESELRVVWLDTRSSMTLATLPSAAMSPTWSPDGERIAFSMFVRDAGPTPAALPDQPEGAEWAEPAKVIDRVLYRADGRGFLEQGEAHQFILPADGGAPRRLTFGEYAHNGPISFTPDGKRLIFTSNQQPDWEFDPIDSEIFELTIETGEQRALTDRNGPDGSPAISPDGRRIAYVGFEDREQGYQINRLSVLDLETGATRTLTDDLDRSVRSPRWDPAGGAIYFQYDTRGVTTIGRVTLEGRRQIVASNVGGTTLGRPYASGSFSVGPGGRVATVVTSPTRPGDVAVGDSGGLTRLTRLNEDALGHKTLAEAEPLTVRSTAGDQPVQAWVMRPPWFDPGRTYPLVMEIHGGPFANYGPRFSAENQLFAGAGYIVVYANPRGSTSYGESFGNLIHHAYPGEDYDDLMTVIDAVLEREPVDPERMFVTGGSGGGVLTAWIVGKTDRFAAAVVAKPVINWISFALTADMYPYFEKYWFPGPAWEHVEHYWNRSPLSLVGGVTTPTMLLTGEEDLRTPIGESEQYFQALQMRGVPTRFVRIPGASHGIAARPSRLLAKVANIIQWFEEHDPATEEGERTAAR